MGPSNMPRNRKHRSLGALALVALGSVSLGGGAGGPAPQENPAGLGGAPGGGRE
jgi:hypothetical protein